MPTKQPARDRILDAASRLFYAHGVAGTGIDAIIAEAGVAKMSLYNNFSGKDEVVTAYLERRHQELLDLYAARITETSDARQRVLAMFDAYTDHAMFPYVEGFRGCGLLNAAGEFAMDDAKRALIRGQKEEIEAMLVAAVGSSLGVELAYLLEGGMVRAGLDGDPQRTRDVRNRAAALLDREGL